MAIEIKKENASPLPGEDLLTEKLKELSGSLVNRHPSLRGLEGVWVEIDNFDQKIIGKINLGGESIVQLEQQRSFLHKDSHFELVFTMLPNDRLFNLRMTRVKAGSSGVTIKEQRIIYQNAPADLAGVIRRTRRVLSEEDLGVAHCPDELDTKVLIERVVAGEFALAGIWDPEGEAGKP